MNTKRMACPLWMLLVTIGSFSIGNFVFQSFGFYGPPNWDIAFERSFFQAIALLCAWVAWAR